MDVEDKSSGGSQQHQSLPVGHGMMGAGGYKKWVPVPSHSFGPQNGNIMPGGGGLHVNCLAGMNNGNNASAPAPSAMATAGSSGAPQQSQQSMPGSDPTSSGDSCKN